MKRTPEQRQRIAEATKAAMSRPDVRQRLSQAIKDNHAKYGHPMQGKKHKKSTISKMSETHKRVSNQEDQKARSSRIFKSLWSDPFKRNLLLKHIQHPSDSARKLMSLAKKGYVPWNKGLQYDNGANKVTQAKIEQHERDKIDPARIRPDWLVDLIKTNSRGVYWSDN